MLFLLLISTQAFAQKDTTWLRAFPITDYMVPLNDSTTVVQLEMPEGLKLKDKQLGLVYGVYDNSKETAVEKGFGKCYLIKSVYHYFAISQNKSGKQLQKGDLLYTFLPLDKNVFMGRIPKMAGHFIRLLNVHGEPFYDRYHVFNKWTEADEKKMIDSLIADIQFTGTYFLDAQPSLNERIRSGPYEGEEILEFMAECQPSTVEEFLDYVFARPRLYAGKEWKIAEIFATWLKEGSPGVVK